MAPRSGSSSSKRVGIDPAKRAAGRRASHLPWRKGDFGEVTQLGPASLGSPFRKGFPPFLSALRLPGCDIRSAVYCRAEGTRIDSTQCYLPRCLQVLVSLIPFKEKKKT